MRRRWNPPTPEEVTDAMIDRIFEPLPARRGLDAAWEPTHDRQPRLEAARKRPRSGRARRRLDQGGRERPRRDAGRRAAPPPSLAFDPTAPARAMADFTVQLWSNPMAVLQASQAAASEWMELWGAAARRAAGQRGRAGDRARARRPPLRRRRPGARTRSSTISSRPICSPAARRPSWSTRPRGSTRPPAPAPNSSPRPI